MQIARQPLRIVLFTCLALPLMTACINNPITGLDSAGKQKAQTALALMSAKQCTDVGGELVGDLGDGRIHRPDYLCNNGTAPLGTIKTQDEPVMTEGAVCCGP